MAKILNYKVLITQGWNMVWFRLSQKEFEAMPKDEYNFSWYAWADTELSPSKRARFHRLFDYEKKDFYIWEVHHTILRG